MILGLSLVVTLAGAEAVPLAPIEARDIQALICCSEEVSKLSGAASAIFVRVLAVSDPSECHGPTCANEYLFIGVTDTFDSGAATAYRLPASRGWEFIKWVSYPKALDGVAVFQALRITAEGTPDGYTQPYEQEVTIEVGLERAAIVKEGPRRVRREP